MTCIRAELTSEEKDSRGAASTTLMVSLLPGCTVAKPPDAGAVYQYHLYNTYKKLNTPNHFFEVFPDSMTSIIPGRRASMEGTWFARIPMSPVAAATFTWTTSLEEKIA